MSEKFTGFDQSLIRFLKQLKRNNNRDWFAKNKSKYESDVLEPAMSFIRTFEPKLEKISDSYIASDKRVGGSLMRIYRDTRFSKDKTPYKTNVGIFFRHEMCGDIHAPGFYIHIEPGQCFWGVGTWHPDSESLGLIREAIVNETAAWKRARDNRKFRSVFQISGDSLKSAPRGYAKDHPLIEDLRRTDHVSMRHLTDDEVLAPDFLKNTAAAFSASRPYVRFLCDALDIPF